MMNTDTKTHVETDAAGAAKLEKDHGVLYVGMDLGTSRTSVACSNGVRETVASVVGYPKDPVARKLLKRDILFGKDAFDNRLSLDFYRPLGKGVIKYSDDPKERDSEAAKMNLKAATDLVRQAISMAQARKDELVYAVIGAPAEASIHNRKAIIDAAREVVDSVMLCSEPFSVAYGLDRLTDTLVIDIGAGTTDLCRMHGTMPSEDDQVMNTVAGDYVDQTLLELIQKEIPKAQLNVNMVRLWKERWGTVRETVQPIVVQIPIAGKPTEIDITQSMRAACRTLIGPILDGLEKLISTYDPEFQDRLKDNVLLGGGGSQIDGLGDALEIAMRDRFGRGAVTTVEEPIYAGANGALKIAHDMPAEYWEKLR